MSNPSNNLKDGVAEIIRKENLAYMLVTTGAEKRQVRDIAATQILNLILDTILASEEMQDELLMGAVTGNNFFTADQDDLIKDRNQLRASWRTMLEGLK